MMKDRDQWDTWPDDGPNVTKVPTLSNTEIASYSSIHKISLGWKAILNGLNCIS